MGKLSFSECGKLGAIAAKQINEKIYLERVREYESNPKLCNFCSIPMSYKQRRNKFCGHSCSIKFTLYKKYDGDYSHVKGDSSLRVCRACENKTRNPIYCSRKCQWKYRWTLQKKQIESEGKTTKKHAAKKFITERDGYKCSICSISEWMNEKLSLIMDHINGNPEDWSLTNLRLLCPNCDSQTPTFKGRNAGNGRHSRRERYKSGKSY